MIKHAAYSFAVIVSLVGVLLFLWALGLWTLAHAHDSEVVACFTHTPVSFVRASVHPTGLWAEGYDDNDDGLPDIMTLSPITGYEYDWTKDHNNDVTVLHQDHPLLYVIDTDHDRYPDIVYVDRVGNGVCGDIEVYDVFKRDEDKEASNEWRGS